MVDDLFNLQRFLDAQAGIYPQVLKELRKGRKTSHWMWFIFPQIQGLGSSATAEKYAIRSRAEAEAYLRHDVLGPRMIECTQLVLDVGASVEQIFGYPDDRKFHSSMTLFAAVATPEQRAFGLAIEKYFSGQIDVNTMKRLAAGAGE